jgi:plastocyanin
MSLRKVAIIGFVCLVIIGAGTYVLITKMHRSSRKAIPTVSSKTVQAKPLPHPNIGPISQPLNKNVVVLFDQYGFEPNQFQVPIGVTVEVTNASTAPLLFMALPGQADQLYVLDLGMIAPGSSKSFTVNRLGSWQFQANNNPALRGEISTIAANPDWNGLSALQLPRYNSATHSLLINYTDYGFVPNISSVPVGTKVTILNSTDEGGMYFRQLTSDSEQNPALDLGILEMGQSKSFTLNVKGVWHFVNAWETTDKGQITSL